MLANFFAELFDKNEQKQYFDGILEHQDLSRSIDRIENMLVGTCIAQNGHKNASKLKNNKNVRFVI